MLLSNDERQTMDFGIGALFSGKTIVGLHFAKIGKFSTKLGHQHSSDVEWEY